MKLLWDYYSGVFERYARHYGIVREEFKFAIAVILVLISALLALDLLVCIWPVSGFFEGILVEAHGIVLELVIVFIIIGFIVHKVDKNR